MAAVNLVLNVAVYFEVTLLTLFEEDADVVVRLAKYFKHFIFDERPGLDVFVFLKTADFSNNKLLTHYRDDLGRLHLAVRLPAYLIMRNFCWQVPINLTCTLSPIDGIILIDCQWSVFHSYVPVLIRNLRRCITHKHYLCTLLSEVQSVEAGVDAAADVMAGVINENFLMIKEMCSICAKRQPREEEWNVSQPMHISSHLILLP